MAGMVCDGDATERSEQARPGLTRRFHRNNLYLQRNQRAGKGGVSPPRARILSSVRRLHALAKKAEVAIIDCAKADAIAIGAVVA
jgi:hypothetical protein